MSLLSAGAILEASDLPFVDVDVPEWGGTVRVRTLTGTELDAYEAENFVQTESKVTLNRSDLRARLLVRAIVGEDGKPLFNAKQIADLGRKSAKVLDRLFETAQTLSGIGKDTKPVGNSPSGLGAASTSDSQA